MLFKNNGDVNSKALPMPQQLAVIITGELNISFFIGNGDGSLMLILCVSCKLRVVRSFTRDQSLQVDCVCVYSHLALFKTATKLEKAY